MKFCHYIKSGIFLEGLNTSKWAETIPKQKEMELVENRVSENYKVIVFQLQEEEYALPVEHVGAIERIHPITRVPQTAVFVKGVINLRGVVIPIVDLRLRFGMKEKDLSDENRIIIVSANGLEVGLIVDAASDVIDIPAEHIEPNPEVVGTVAVDYIEGVIKIQERLIIMLNLEKILSSEKKYSLKTEG